jgi:ElaB/YqjD/DUF883 family membrane-anchored ribosome-binding protein
MDDSQIDKLGSKMRDVYADVATEAPVPAETISKHPSRRLRKSRTFAGASRRQAASASSSAAGNLITRHPIASLVAAASVGYLLARL